MPGFGFPAPASGGRPERAPGGSAKPPMPGKMPFGGAPSGGQIMISGPEEKALRVLELDPEDDADTFMRASRESGLTPQRVEQLAARAEAARQKGITLKGPTLTLQPLSPMQGDGLIGEDPLADVDGMSGEEGATDPSLLDAVGGSSPDGMRGPAGATAGAMAGGKPQGGSMADGATMSSAGMGTQRYAPAWRPQMSQAMKAPPRMTPDVNSAPPPGADRAKLAIGAAGRAAVGQMPGGQGEAVAVKRMPAGPAAVGVKTAYGPAAKPVPPRKAFSARGAASFGNSSARDTRLAAAYVRERGNIEECDECGGTCGGKNRPIEETGGPGCRGSKKRRRY